MFSEEYYDDVVLDAQKLAIEISERQIENLKLQIASENDDKQKEELKELLYAEFYNKDKLRKEDEKLKKLAMEKKQKKQSDKDARTMQLSGVNNNTNTIMTAASILAPVETDEQRVRREERKIRADERLKIILSMKENGIQDEVIIKGMALSEHEKTFLLSLQNRFLDKL